jgi:hypothetical protein
MGVVGIMGGLGIMGDMGFMGNASVLIIPINSH